MVGADIRRPLANCSSDRKVVPLSTLPGCGGSNSIDDIERLTLSAQRFANRRTFAF
jgi:hypothetical protein